MIRINILRYSYVDSAPIKNMKLSAVGKSWFQWIKAQLNIGKYIMSSGYKQLKKDLPYYYNNFSKKLTGTQQNRMIQTRNNLLKLPPIGLLFCLPGGIPFILIYMIIFPALTPTWFLVDSYKQQLQRRKKEKQIQALKYFIECGAITVNQNQTQNQNKFNTALNLESLKNMNLYQQKKLQELCYGQAFDGTNLIRSSIKLNLDYFLTPNLSSFFIVKNMEQKLNGEQFSQISQNMDILTEKVLREVKILYKQLK